MTSKKRNTITKARKDMLKQPGVIYTIRCTESDCDCKHFGVDCRRGFFSLWIQAVYGIYFGNNLKVENYIDFGDKPYLYSDPARFDGSLNFWNYYYIQERQQAGRTVPNNHVETYPLRIWQRDHLRAIHNQAVKTLQLKPQVKEHIDSLLNSFSKFRTLGVHIRGTDHPEEVPRVPIERYLGILHKHLKSYQKFFIATDDQRMLETIINEFGPEQILFQEATRSNTDQAVHTDLQHQDRYQLGLQVLADCYALSSCQKAILAHSNVSYGALLLNPELSYYLMESSESLSSRLKTGLLYSLDRWGIRKM